MLPIDPTLRNHHNIDDKHELGVIILNSSSIVKYCHEKTYQQGDVFCCYDAERFDDFSPDMLSANYWQLKDQVVGTAQGRGTTYFVESNKYQWVLRHYYRGGLVGKLIHDSYLFTGYKNTRAAQEFQLLKKLVELNLPAPQPIAYRVIKSGLVYHADILTGRIEQAKDLVALLSEGKLSDDVWCKVGRCLNLFHKNGIYHHDLNAHNILIDHKNKVWLIDFDRGEQRSIDKQWQEANLGRLLRSFKKERSRLANFHWQTENWNILIESYLKG